MKLLKPGDPCPCCGQPIPDGLPTENILILRWLAEGKAILDAGRFADEPCTADEAPEWKQRVLRTFLGGREK